MTIIKKTYMALLLLVITATLAACSNNNDAIFAELDLPTETTESFVLPTKIEKYPDAKILWISQNPLVITNVGQVIRQDSDIEVILTAYISRPKKKQIEKDFTIKVTGFGTAQKTERSYMSLYGFGHDVIKNRNSTAADKKASVATEVEFLDALYDKNITIINITKDLNMGYYNVVKKLKEAGISDDLIETKYTSGSFYRMNNNAPMQHPRLMEQGVGQLVIQERMDGLMIYSETGITISHMTTQIKDCQDIVFRNLHLTGIWEWDDDLSANYDANDWDHFTIERTQGVWLDHLTLDQTYDGLVDVKGFTSNITISYLNLDFQPTEFIKEQVDYLEKTLIEEGVPGKTIENSRYMLLRETLSVETIFGYTSMQKKGFNFGNTTQGAGFDTITITLHDLFIRNLQDRLPRLRRGDVHVYNVFMDATDILNYKAQIGTAASLINQAIVPTEQGAVLMENSKLVNVMEPIKTHQDNIMTEEFTGRYQVINSILQNRTDVYYGSSIEYGSRWYKSNTNVDWILEFFMRNHQVIPYQYRDQLIDPELLHNALLDSKVGAGEKEGFNWLLIVKSYSDNNEVKSTDYHRMDEDSVYMPSILLDVNEENTPISGINGETGAIISFPYRQVIKNFYPNPNLRENVDYKLEIDFKNLDYNKVGTYEIVYKYQSLINDWDSFEKEQTVIVFDANDANEIYSYKISDEFDGKINVTYSMYSDQGKMYYYLATEANLTINDVISLGSEVTISQVRQELNNLETGRKQYLYMVTTKDDLTSKLVRHKITLERIVEISTAQQFDDMLTSGIQSQNRYYKLTNDIDFTGFTLSPLTTQSLFAGVFDGQGFTIKNITALKQRAGIFFTVQNGMIKNLVLDNIQMTTGETIVYPDIENTEIFDLVKPADDAGILAVYAYNMARFENITIKNSKVTTVKNYVGAILGRVRTGTAYFENISLINNEIKSITTDAKYTGGFIGGAEANTFTYFNNLYANGLTISHADTDMIGAILGRVRATTHISNVVMVNVNVKGRHNIGMIAGKEEQTVKEVIFKDVYINANLELHPDPSNVYSQYYGYIYGNPDALKTVVERIFMTEITGPNINMASSKGNNSVTVVAKEQVNQAWFEANLPNIANNELWEYADNTLRLVNSNR